YTLSLHDALPIYFSDVTGVFLRSTAPLASSTSPPPAARIPGSSAGSVSANAASVHRVPRAASPVTHQSSSVIATHLQNLTPVPTPAPLPCSPFASFQVPSRENRC